MVGVAGAGGSGRSTLQSYSPQNGLLNQQDVAARLLDGFADV